jgi:hypothetical protein
MQLESLDTSRKLQPQVEQGAQRDLDTFLHNLQELERLLAYLQQHSQLASARQAIAHAQSIFKRAMQECSYDFVTALQQGSAAVLPSAATITIWRWRSSAPPLSARAWRWTCCPSRPGPWSCAWPRRSCRPAPLPRWRCTWLYATRASSGAAQPGAGARRRRGRGVRRAAGAGDPVLVPAAARAAGAGHIGAAAGGGGVAAAARRCRHHRRRHPPPAPAAAAREGAPPPQPPPPPQQKQQKQKQQQQVLLQEQHGLPAAPAGWLQGEAGPACVAGPPAGLPQQQAQLALAAD